MTEIGTIFVRGTDAVLPIFKGAEPVDEAWGGRREVLEVGWRVEVVADAGPVFGLDLEVEGLFGTTDAVGVVPGSKPLPLPIDVLVSLVERWLSPLVALLVSPMLSSTPPFRKVFQSHSPPRELSHFALQPTPTPSTAALGSSCSLKSNQFA